MISASVCLDEAGCGNAHWPAAAASRQQPRSTYKDVETAARVPSSCGANVCWPRAGRTRPPAVTRAAQRHARAENSAGRQTITAAARNLSLPPIPFACGLLAARVCRSRPSIRSIFCARLPTSASPERHRLLLRLTSALLSLVE